MGLNSKCTNNEMCDNSKGLICLRNICSCQEGQFFDTIKCGKKKTETNIIKN